MRELKRTLITAAALGALAGCGGSSTPSVTTGLTARSTQGAITALSTNSVTVNGVSIDDSSAAVKVDDKASASKDDLKLGQIVMVKVDDKGKATEVHSHPDLRGKVDSTSASSVSIGGQVVRVDDSTHFDDSAARLASIHTADRVRVSAFPDDKGGLRATRIEKDASGLTDFEVRGVATGIGAGGFTLTVSPAAAPYTVTLATGVALPSPFAEKSIVEVRSATQPSGSALLASAVKIDDDARLGDANTEADVEGIVAVGGTSASFVINARTVTTSAATKWVGGAPADLVPGVKVEAEGKLDAQGGIAASKVSFRDSLRFQSTVASVAAGADARNGSFKMLGGNLTVHVSDATEFDSGLADLTALAALTTQGVEVRGYPSLAGGNDIVATRVRLGSGGGGASSTRIIIQGPVTGVNVAAKTCIILGFTINAANASTLGKDDNPMSTDVALAFSTLANGAVVKARADTAAALSGTTLTAKEVELEDDP